MMSMFTIMAIICGLASMISYGFANVYSQPLAKKLGPAQMLFLRGIVISIILAFISSTSLRELSQFKEVAITFLLGIAGYLPVLAFTHGIKISRVGIISPIAGSAPLITVLLTFLILHTGIHLLQWFAILIIIGANIVMSIDLRNWRNSNALQLSSGIPFALMAALGWGCFYFFLVYSTNWLGPWLSAFLVEIGVTFAAGIHLLLLKKTIPFKAITSQAILGNSILLCIGTVAYTFGVRNFNISIVAALSNSVAIVSAIGATYLLHEHLTKKEKLAAAAMILGILTLTLF